MIYSYGLHICSNVHTILLLFFFFIVQLDERICCWDAQFYSFPSSFSIHICSYVVSIFASCLIELDRLNDIFLFRSAHNIYGLINKSFSLRSIFFPQKMLLINCLALLCCHLSSKLIFRSLHMILLWNYDRIWHKMHEKIIIFEKLLSNLAKKNFHRSTFIEL